MPTEEKVAALLFEYDEARQKVREIGMELEGAILDSEILRSAVRIGLLRPAFTVSEGFYKFVRGIPGKQKVRQI